MTPEYPISYYPISCERCQRYRMRIHALAAALDKERAQRRIWESERNWLQNETNTALHRLYGRRWWFGHSFRDRHFVGLGLRALLHVGAERARCTAPVRWLARAVRRALRGRG